MPSDLRIIIDTNSLISAILLPGSPCSYVLDNVLARSQLLVSAATVTELTETLHQPKFDRYLSDSQRSDFLAGIVRRSRLIEITTKATLCRDPKDDKFLELAASGCATHLVTGDRDLLVLQHFGETAILSCRDFLTRFS